ncbi:hypothetical protein HY992_03350 [Candidatus Micrarchaeota archaeon]|nr:hypothetical protein [Candidatus Micrarchaeota archaeon]
MRASPGQAVARDSISSFLVADFLAGRSLLEGERAGADVPVLEKVVNGALKELEKTLGSLRELKRENPRFKTRSARAEAEERAALRVAEATARMHEEFIGVC